MNNLQRSFDGLIFDLDGTLADTMPTHYIAWSETMTAHGINFTEERFYQLGGVPAAGVISLLAEEQGISLKEDVESIAWAKEARFLDLATEMSPVSPVRAIAVEHRDRMPMAVATGSQTWLAKKILSALGMLEWFGAVIGADCVSRPKPAPDTYLRAAQSIGVDPAKCHAFEDTAIGMQAARAAGMVVIDVNTLRD